MRRGLFRFSNFVGLSQMGSKNQLTSIFSKVIENIEH